MSQTQVEPDHKSAASAPPTPRWVKVFAGIAIGLVLLFIILHLTGNSLGGPGNHGFSGDHTPPFEQGAPQP
jgi:hypothetical protein